MISFTSLMVHPVFSASFRWTLSWGIVPYVIKEATVAISFDLLSSDFIV